MIHQLDNWYWMLVPYGLLLVGVGLLLVVIPLRRRKSRAKRQEPTSPLVVEIIETQFEDWRRVAVLIAAFRVKITNTTDRAIQVSGYAVTCDSPSWMFQVTGGERLALQREMAARAQDQRYGVPLRNFSMIPAKESVSGWMITAVSRDPAGDTPECVITVSDDLDSEYRTVVARAGY
jgi:hypothetical protein